MENKDWQCQPRGKAEDCQIDHEQASTNNESLYIYIRMKKITIKIRNS
jgi:hypothetical protein